MTSPVPVTGITPVYGIEYLVEGEPLHHTRAKLYRNALQIEDALQSGGVAAPGASDLLAVSGRVSTLEAVVGGQSYAAIQGSGGINILNATWTALPMTGPETDPLNGHSLTVNTTRWTCPPGEGGLYLAGGTVMFFTNTTGRRLAGMRKNGVEVIPSNVTGAPVNNNHQVASAVWPHVLAPGDYLELYAYQDSGVASPGLAVNLSNCGFWLTRLTKF